MTNAIDETPRPRLGSSLLLVVGAAALLATVLADRTVLPDAPPGLALGSWSGWFDGRSPIDVAAGIVRIAVVALLAYLLLISLANLVAFMTPGRWFPLIVHRCTPRLVGAVLAGSLLGASPAVGAAPGPGGSDDIDPGAGATMEILDPAERPHRTQLPWTEPPGHPTGTSSPTGQTVVSETFERTTQDPPAPTSSESGTAAGARTHVVATGDHLWGIAEQHLRSEGLHDVATLAQYWRELIDMNRDRLIDPEDPDLIHPGQELLLPPAP